MNRNTFIEDFEIEYINGYVPTNLFKSIKW